MNIEIKKSQKPVKYEDALKFMEKRLMEIHQKKSNDLQYGYGISTLLFFF